MFIVFVITTKTLLESTGGSNFAYNVYTIFIILPDAIMNGTLFGLLVYTSLHDGINTKFTCYVRQFVSFFYFYTNICMNAFIGYQVYTLVKHSHQGQRLKPPTKFKVCIQILTVYILNLVLCIWIVLNVPWSFYTIIDFETCESQIGSPQPAGIFSETVGTMIASGLYLLPIGYVLYIGYTMYKRNLLSQTW